MKQARQRFAVMIIAVVIAQAGMPHLVSYGQRRRAVQEPEELSLPDGRAGQAYEYQLRTVGGLPPFKWRVVDGELPPGMRLDATGKLKGVPTTPSAEGYSFVIQVSDSSRPPDKSVQAILLTIRPERMRIVGSRPPLRMMPADDTEADSIADLASQSSAAPQQAQRAGTRRAGRPNAQGQQQSEEDPEEHDIEDHSQQQTEVESSGQDDPSVAIVKPRDPGTKPPKATPTVDGELKEGDTVVRVIAAPNVTVSVLVDGKPHGKGITDKNGKVSVTLDTRLSKDSKVKVQEDKENKTATVPPPNINVPLKEGDPKISGTANAKAKVIVSIDDKPQPEVTADGDGKFELTLGTGLVKGQSVTAKQTNSSDSVAIKVGPSGPPKLDPVHAGDPKVSGKGLPKAKVKVTVAGFELKEVDAGDDGTFTRSLDVPLKEGQKIQAQQDSSPLAELTVPDFHEYSWGRVRAYFTGVAILSNRNRNPTGTGTETDTTGNDFTKVDVGLGFNLDKNYYYNTKGSFFINSYFDARLTAIPVAAKPPTTTMASADTPEDPFPTFLASKKAGIAQVGFYAPVAVTEWHFDGEPNRLFIAPLIKGGIQTINSGFTSAEGARLGQDDVYNFFSAGARLGHFKLKYKASSSDKNCKPCDEKPEKPQLDLNIGPELISFIDITMGKWENFEILRPAIDSVTGKPRTDLSVRQRTWRLAAEGRLKIPETPFIVGFDGNFGKGPDDLRFLFGVRFDVGNAFGKLKVLEGLGIK